ncbi:CDP-alcohol phosphatidyltransferase family protein [Spiractinospora alimapuensis]|uniref:CDP-alcohol phosphatidyltransferase family protein n=1 Tax=Spiractinospora alimapuensis TaxID=2820884 RepID=UPI001F358ECC|nr:CDP-alcohol phosphatidyltransferase family protein [Spiractinospora alimapuensis]QVQ53600.1 CDP-alcohol phosphatidyltransferase family protein [Spiractinospora alimapuensis]
MSRTEFSLADVRELTYKSRDSWWTVFLVDPFASRLVRWTANHTNLTPNQLTLGSFVLGVGAAVCFAQVTWPWLLAGAVLFHLSFVLDCMDGKIARLKGTGTVFGGWLDYIFDRLRVLVCAVALLGGYFAVTGMSFFLWVTLLVVVTDMFRYLNAPQMAKVREQTRTGIHIRVAAALPVLGEDELARLLGRRRLDEVRPAEEPTADDEAEANTNELPKPGVGSLSDRFPAYARFRAFLDRHRVRSHLFSGIEFHMGTFIVAPVVGTVTPVGMLAVIVLSSVGMLAAECLLIIRMWQLTRRYEREAARLDSAMAAASAPDAGLRTPSQT